MQRLKILVLLTCALGTLAVQASPTLQDFTRERDYRMAAISPTGRYLAEVWNQAVDNTRIVTVRDLSKPDNPIIGKLSDRVIRANSVSWANDARLLIRVDVPLQTKKVIRDAKKKKDFDIYDYVRFSRTIAVDPDTTNAVMLLEDQNRISGNANLSRIRHYLPNEPNHILMVASRNDRLVQYKVDVNDGSSEKVTQGGKFTFAFINDTNGKPLYRLDFRRLAQQIRIFNLQGDDWEQIEIIELDSEETDDGIERGDLIGVIKDDLIYRKKSEATGYYELWTYNAKHKEYKKLIGLPDKDVLFPITSLRTNDVIGYAMDGKLLRHKYFKESLQARYDKLAEQVGDYNFYFGSWSDEGDLAVINVYGRDNPLSFSLYDFNSGTLRFLGDSHTALSPMNLSLPAQARYKARDGQSIELNLLLPKDYQAGKKYPVVVLPHGGPQARDRADYDDFAQFISTRGYIVAQPNFRGSTGYGKAFEQAGYKQWGGLMQDDVDDAVRFLTEKNMTEPGNACIVGGSYGGYAALMGAIRSADIYRCAVSLNGVTDLPDMIAYDEDQLQDDKLIQKFVYERIGHPKHDLDMLVRRSPARQASKIGVPLLLVAGTYDDIVPYDQTKKLVKALKKHKKPFELVTLKETGHNVFYYREDQVEVYRAVESFLHEHLRE